MKKQKTKIYWLFRVCALSLALVFSSFLLQEQLLAFTPVKNLSFHLAGKVLESGPLYEMRLTDDGHTVQRFFTGNEKMPFLDYMVVTSVRGEKMYIPLRADTKHFEHSRLLFEFPHLFREGNLPEKLNINILLKVILVVSTVLVFSLYAYQNWILLAICLSRQRIFSISPYLRV